MLVTAVVFFFQAEDGIRDAQESRGLGDVYKRQFYVFEVGIVATLQAFIFSILTAIYIGGATAESH